MKNIQTLILLVALMTQCTTSPKETNSSSPAERTLLAIFAHPDDEGTVGPVLAKYAAEGVKVYLCIASDGRLGVNAFAKIPAGDSLAAARKLELECATATLGINPPIMFGLHDQLKMGEGFGPHHDQIDSLRKGVIKLFNELKPDVVITWNASGWTSHGDHRLVGAVVTEVFESQQWSKPSNLYYAAMPTGSIPKGSPMQLATVDESFLTVAISVSEDDYAKAKESWLCHKSQYQPETVEAMHQMLKEASKGIAYFRPHSGDQSPKQSLF